MSLIQELFSSHIHTVRNIQRYSDESCLIAENLAEHCYFVGLIADILAEDIQACHPDMKIDRYKILRYALYHDYEEIYTGDIIAPVKQFSKILKDELSRVGKIMMDEKVTSNFQTSPHITKLIIGSQEEYEENKYTQIENQIIKFADMLQVFQYGLAEIRIGNSNFNRILQYNLDVFLSTWGKNEIFSPYARDFCNYLQEERKKIQILDIDIKNLTNT